MQTARAMRARLGWPLALLAATASLANAATLELSFDQGSFTSLTSGNFRLTGEIPATGYGSAGSFIGDDFVVDYYSFSSDYTLGFTSPPPVPFAFSLQAIASPGTAVRDAVRPCPWP